MQGLGRDREVPARSCLTQSACEAPDRGRAHVGNDDNSFDWMPIMLKRLTVTGSTMRASPAERKVGIASALRERVWPLYETGRAKAVIHRVFPLAEAAAAHALMESSQHVGKIMLEMPSA